MYTRPVPNFPCKRSGHAPAYWIISRSPRGVAFNICKQLALSGFTNLELLTALGDDVKGRAIIAFCHKLGIITDNIYVCDDTETDSYLAIDYK